MRAPWRILVGSGAMGAIGNLAQIMVLVVAYRWWLSFHGPVETDRWLVLVAFANMGDLCDSGVAGAAVQRIAHLTGGERVVWCRAAGRFLVGACAIGGCSAAIAVQFWSSAGVMEVGGPLPISLLVGSWSAALIWGSYQAGLLKAQLRFGASAAVLAMQQAGIFPLPALNSSGSLMIRCVIATPRYRWSR